MTQPEGIPLVDVAVSGSRTGFGADFVADHLTELDEERGGIFCRHGACPRGVDAHTQAWGDKVYAATGRTVVEGVPADWDNCGPECPPRPHRFIKRLGDVDHPGLLDDYCPGAGPRRNRELLLRAPKPRLALVFIGACKRPRCRLSGPHGSHGATGTALLAEGFGIPVVAFVLAPRSGEVVRIEVGPATLGLKAQLQPLYGRVRA